MVCPEIESGNNTDESTLLPVPIVPRPNLVETECVVNISLIKSMIIE